MIALVSFRRVLPLPLGYPCFGRIESTGLDSNQHFSPQLNKIELNHELARLCSRPCGRFYQSYFNPSNTKPSNDSPISFLFTSVEFARSRATFTASNNFPTRSNATDFLSAETR